MEPQVKRVRLQDGGEHLDLEVEEVVDLEVERMAELEESLRSALMSTLPVLKSKVELFSKLKEGQLKEKVEKLENCLAEKERVLNQLKRKSNEKHDELSKKVEVFRILFNSYKDEKTVKKRNSNC